MQLATVILQIVLAIGQAIAAALDDGDWSVLDRPVRDLLPAELKITLARKQAEAEADARFGAPEPPPNPFEGEPEGE